MKKDVIIHYDDLDDNDVKFLNSKSIAVSSAPLAASEVNTILTGLSIIDDDEGSNAMSKMDDDSAIHEPEDDVDPMQEDADLRVEKSKLIKAIEPTKDKPTKKFISPIQLITKVPKVLPLTMSTVFLMKLVGEWPTQTTGSSSDTKRKQGIVEEDKGPPKVESMQEIKPVDNWKTRMMKRIKKSNPFRTTNYLDSLSAGATSSSDDDTKLDISGDDCEVDHEKMLRSLRTQHDQLIANKRESMLKAMRNATRRTTRGVEDVIAKRIEEAQTVREKKETDRLERLFVERKARLDAKLRADRACEMNKKSEKKEREMIPILDFMDMPPLIVGSELTIPYADLTSFQQRAVDMAWSNREVYSRRMIDNLDDVGSVEAVDKGGRILAPLIACVDGYTVFAKPPSLPPSQQKQGWARRRYATLASTEILECDDGIGGLSLVVKLMGVGRSFLRKYTFVSKGSGDAITMKKDQELSDILARVRDFNNTSNNNNEDNELPIIMAEFDVFFDDSSGLEKRLIMEQSQENCASSAHVIAELYRAANRVYRLHEERKRLVAALRTGTARLRQGEKRMVTGNVELIVELEDYDDDLSLARLALNDITKRSEGMTLVSTTLSDSKYEDDAPIRRELKAIENCGFGFYGILSTIPELTHQTMSQLNSYYSPEHLEREEYEAEIASMAVLRTLEEYATPSELAVGLLAPSAIRRFELEFDIMVRYKESLHELVRIINEELMYCSK